MKDVALVVCALMATSLTILLIIAGTDSHRDQ